MPTLPIPSPYNFVPLSEHVLLPGWAAQVSQDVPFKDGLSGWFELEVEATTPVYIRNGGDHPARDPQRPRDWLDNPDVQSFFKLPDGRFGVPGTSIKGMLRNVLEIACFAKFKPVDARRYGVRDLKNPDPTLYRNRLSQGDPNTGYAPRALPGWLEQTADGEWQIIPCKMARVEQSMLEALASGVNLGRKQSAAQKYEAWQQAAGTLCVNATIAPIGCHRHHSQPMRYQAVTDLSLNAFGRVAHDPTVVFTGQPQQRRPQRRDDNGRMKSGGKHMEFVFFDPQRKALPVRPEVREDFLFIHSRPEGGDNDELAYLKRRFWKNKLPLPVFYLLDLLEGCRVTAIGLAMMFRLPYLHTPAEVAAAQQPDSTRRDALDLAETIFGTAESDEPSRGRVQFEAFPAVPGTARPAPASILTVLNSPKPTYYPNYLEQEMDHCTGKVLGPYRTYMNPLPKPGVTGPVARLRGWKRYVCLADGFTPNPPRPPADEQGRENLRVATSFLPLQAGARFRGRVHFHNLRPIELGALLWVITWGGNANCRHRLGMGKPYGYGHIRLTFPASCSETPSCQIVSVSENHLIAADDTAWAQLRQQCLDVFTTHMDAWCAERGLGSWHKTSQLRALVALATPVSDPEHDWIHPVRYAPTPKDYSDFKGRGVGPLALLPAIPAQSAQIPDQPADIKAQTNAKTAPQKALPDLTGQKRRVSFLRRQHFPGAAAESLVFRLKVGNEKFEARLDHPTRPELAGQLIQGASFELFVSGVADGRYLLSETDPAATPEE